MKKIKNRHNLVEKLVNKYPNCPVCGIPFEEELNIAKIRFLYPKFRGWSASDIYQYFFIDVHHILKDNDHNRKKYGDELMDSPLFARPIMHGCHMENPGWGCISEKEADELSGNSGKLEEMK